MSELITIDGPGPLNQIGAPAIDWTKPVETKNGRPVHVYAIDHRLLRPVIGLLQDDDSVTDWGYDGVFHSDRRACSLDLRNVQEALK